MKKYLFLFKRQQLQFLIGAIAIAMSGIVLTTLFTMLLYNIVVLRFFGTEIKFYFNSLAWLSFVFPCAVAYYRKQICKKISTCFFFVLLAVSVSAPMVWIIAKSSFNLVLLSLISCMFLFILSCYWGLKAKSFIKFEIISLIMFGGIMISSLFECIYFLFKGGNMHMYFTFCIAALVFGIFNAHDVFQFRKKLPEGIGMEKHEIIDAVMETAVSLYINLIGMIFIIDFMKFLVKLIAEKPRKKSSS